MKQLSFRSLQSLISTCLRDAWFILEINNNLETFFMFLRLGRVENVDTSTFRTATWNYIHLVFGIYHDDYLYTEVCSTYEKKGREGCSKTYIYG